MVLPPEQKTKSAKKRLGLNVQAVFSQSLRVQQVAPTSLCKGGKKIDLFLFGALWPLYRQSKWTEVDSVLFCCVLNFSVKSQPSTASKQNFCRCNLLFKSQKALRLFLFSPKKHFLKNQSSFAGTGAVSATSSLFARIQSEGVMRSLKPQPGSICQ